MRIRDEILAESIMQKVAHTKVMNAPDPRTYEQRSLAVLEEIRDELAAARVMRSVEAVVPPKPGKRK